MTCKTSRRSNKIIMTQPKRGESAGMKAHLYTPNMC